MKKKKDFLEQYIFFVCIHWQRNFLLRSPNFSFPQACALKSLHYSKSQLIPSSGINWNELETVIKDGARRARVATPCKFLEWTTDVSMYVIVEFSSDFRAEHVKDVEHGRARYDVKHISCPIRDIVEFAACSVRYDLRTCHFVYNLADIECKYLLWIKSQVVKKTTLINF